jgi:hypothetical protein
MAHIIWLTFGSQKAEVTYVPRRPSDGTVCQNFQSEIECQISQQKLQALQAKNDRLRKIYDFLRTEKWHEAWALVLRLRAGESLESLCRFVEMRTR